MPKNPELEKFTTELNKRLDSIGTAVERVAEDVKFLTETLNRIQNSPGTLSTEDQADLDAALARLDQLNTRLEAVDSLTTPVVTPTPENPA